MVSYLVVYVGIKRQDTLVMDNGHFVTLIISVYIAIIALVGYIFTRLQLVKIPRPLCNSSQYCILNSCNNIYILNTYMT